MSEAPVMKLAGRRALVTGASRGLGAAVALRLAAEGARLVITARSAPDLAEISRQAPGCVPITANLANWSETQHLLANVDSELGGVDILVNNASTVEPLGGFFDLADETWERALTINLLGPARLCRAVLRHMMPAGWGRIVNISSGAAAGPGIKGASAYTVAKAALESMTRVLAMEVSQSGTTVNAVRPGTMNTQMQRRMREAGSQELNGTTRTRYQKMFDEGLLADPGDVAEFVVRLIKTGRTGEILDVRRADDWALLSESD